MIWVLRASTILFGVLATSLSIYVRSIYALWVLCSDLVYVILFPQLTCAIYFPSSNTYGSFAAFVIGIIFRLAGGENTFGLDPLIKYPWSSISDKGEVIQLFPYKTFSMLSSLFALLVVSWFTNWLFDNEIVPAKFDFLRSSSTGSKRTEKYAMAVNGTPSNHTLSSMDEPKGNSFTSIVENLNVN